METDVRIKINYFLHSLEQWREVNLTPEEYFDTRMLDEGEVFQVDSIPLYDDLIKYFFLSVSNDIEKISAEIYDVMSEKRISFFQNFWNEQNNWFLERIDYEGGSATYRALITVLQQSKSPRITEIIRAIDQDGFLVPEYHGIITENDDDESEKIVFHQSH